MSKIIEKFKIGDAVICIDDDSDNADFGASGTILPGRRDLKEGKEYIIEAISTRHVPTDMSHWREDERDRIKYYWTQFKLKNVTNEAWAHLFKRAKPDSANEVISKETFKK